MGDQSGDTYINKMKEFFKLSKLIHNVSTLKPKKGREAERTAFIVILRSRHCSTAYWIYTLSPYNLNSNSIQAAFWDDSQCHTLNVRQCSIEEKFKSTLWEPTLVARLYLDQTTIPYNYLTCYNPTDIMTEISETDNSSDIVGLILYHQNRLQRSIAVSISISFIHTYQTLTKFVNIIPYIRHQSKMRLICEQLHLEPPNKSKTFLGGIIYQESKAEFEFDCCASKKLS